MFLQLKNIRQKVTELHGAICVAWSIILSRSNGLDITPDEVSSELVQVKESVYRQLRGNHSQHVRFSSLHQRLVFNDGKAIRRKDYVHTFSACLRCLWTGFPPLSKSQIIAASLKPVQSLIEDMLSWTSLTLSATSLQLVQSESWCSR